MKQRMITGLIMAAVLIPLLVIGSYATLALTIVLSYAASYELLNMFSKKETRLSKYRYVYPLFSVLITSTSFFIANGHITTIGGPDWLFLLTMIILVFVFAFIICLVDAKLKMVDVGYFFIAFIYGGIMFSVLSNIRYISSVGLTYDAKYLGLFLFVYLIASTMCTDIGAYFVGSKFGKHKLCPVVSPKKSVEGAIGGSVIGTVCGSIILIIIQVYYKENFFMDGFFNYILTILLTAVITVIGQIGDLVASKFKRDFGIKDYSNLFPGHGGVLDRFDSLLLTGAFFYLVCLYIGIF